MPKKNKNSTGRDQLTPKQLEDYEPGATQEEIMAALKRAAKPTEEPSPRRAKKPQK